MANKGNKLTPKQERFCLNLLQGMSQREAYIKAGYSPNTKPEAMDVRACELAKVSKVQVRLAELLSRTQNDAIMSVIERKERLSEIARAKLPDFVAESGAITLDNDNNSAISEYVVEEWKGSEDIQTRSRKIKLHNPIHAIQELNRMEMVGTPAGTVINNSNTTINVLVRSEGSKQLLDSIGNRPRQLMAGPAEDNT